jgi:hypothetical protein
MGFMRGFFCVWGCPRVCFCVGFGGFIPYTVGLKSNFEVNWKMKQFADLFY